MLCEQVSSEEEESHPETRDAFEDLYATFSIQICGKSRRVSTFHRYVLLQERKKKKSLSPPSTRLCSLLRAMCHPTEDLLFIRTCCVEQEKIASFMCTALPFFPFEERVFCARTSFSSIFLNLNRMRKRRGRKKK